MKQIIALAILLAFISCKNELPEDFNPSGNEEPFTALEVEESFDFSNAVATDISLSANEQTVFKIYTADPEKGGKIMYKAFTGTIGNVDTELNFPADLQSVWVEAFGPNGAYEEMDVPLNDGSIQIQALGGGSNGNGGGTPNLTAAQQNCTACDMYLDASSSSNININSNSDVNVICIASGENYTGRINLNKNGVEIRVCGSGDFNGISMNGNSSVLIVNGTVLTDNLNMNQASDQVVVNTNATLNVNANLSFAGTIENFGSMSVSSNISTNGAGATLDNSGSLNLQGTLNVNSNCTYNNYGTVTIGNNFAVNGGFAHNYGTHNISNNLNVNANYSNYSGATTNVGGKCQVNGSATLTNECALFVEDDFILNSLVYNYGYIETPAQTTVNGGGVLTLGSGMLSTGNISVNGTITGDANSRIDVSGSTTVNGLIGGNLVFCDENGTETVNGTIAPTVNQSCSAGYPTVACDAGDNDGDGVNNGGDDFPGLPDVTFSSFYPSEGNFGTFMFEDLFPNKGDYDFNDLVVQYQFETITNASNQVVQLKARFLVQAIGAAHMNGFGFQLPGVPASAVYSVTGYPYSPAAAPSTSVAANGVEVNQSNATFVVFDNVTSFMGLGAGSRYNVYDNQTPAGNPGVVELEITFLQPQTSIGAAPFNPFIYVGQNRGKEVHLKGFMPTDLADLSFFGTGDDQSNLNNGFTYQTTQFHPWGLDVPAVIPHMEEGVDFLNGYTQFDDHAQSNGTSFQDWYSNPSYRDQAVLRPTVQ